MKTSSPAILLLCLAFALGAVAGDKAARRAAKQYAPATIKQYDVNGDGKLDDKEMAALEADMKKKGKRKAPPPKTAPGLADPGVPLVPTK